MDKVIDLHIHTTCSDGKDTPAEVLKKAQEKGLSVISITDHYNVDAYDELHSCRDLFDGKVNAVACIGEGTIKMGGMISMIDNINRILDRVALYLA